VQQLENKKQVYKITSLPSVQATSVFTANQVSSISPTKFIAP